MTDYFKKAARYGRSLMVTSAQSPQGRTITGYIGPADGRGTARLAENTRLGKMNKEEYLLIADPSAIIPGETALTVAADGKLYQVLRAEPIFVGGGIGHWEGVLRLKGAAADA